LSDLAFKQENVIQQPLGQLLISKELISPVDLEKALELQQKISARIGAILIRIGALSEDSLLPVLAEQLQMPLLTSNDLPSDYRALHSWLAETGLTPDWWLDQETLAWEQADGSVACVARDPLDNNISEILERTFQGRKLTWYLLRGHDLEQALNHFAAADNTRADLGNDGGYLRELAEEAPVIEFVNNLLAQAFDLGASDLHIEPEEHRVQIRIRVDGVLYNKFTLPKERFKAIASRIKLVSGMDIAEQRLPQDGHLDTRASGEALDIRVSALPGVYGESIVMRLLPKEKQRFDIDSLGLAPDYHRSLRRWAQEPHGIILVTGPTGSGKSTTLYSLLESVKDGERKIITVEDPVEYRLPGITQIQVQEEIDYTFSRALRAILRQDPDVIMIGEIRDGETAEIAIQSSLTGHLVLSTLHTNDAISAFTRLIDMGVEPFLVATPIRAVMAQRLVRRLCPHCAIPAEPVADVKQITQQMLTSDLAQYPPKWRAPVGCDHCQRTGYRGRIGIHELVPVTPDIQHQIVQGASVTQLRELARQQGVRNLREDGFVKAYQGITSVEEVLRVTAS
jgi:general secretion pathway protein E